MSKAAIIPPMTVEPSTRRATAPEPVANQSGRHDEWVVRRTNEYDQIQRRTWFIIFETRVLRERKFPGAEIYALNYTLTLWSRLSRFLDYPQLELSNNLAENAIRPVALGRKNWIHIGSKEAGPRVAAIVSIVETCRRLNIPLRDYLISILPGLADRPISQTAELTPAAWAKRNISATMPTSSAA